MGSPIRIFTDQRSFAPPRNFSQLIASFFACMSLGIPRALLVTSFVLMNLLILVVITLTGNLPNFFQNCFLFLRVFRRGKILLITCQRTFCVPHISRYDTAHCRRKCVPALNVKNLFFYPKNRNGFPRRGGKRIRTDDPLRARQVL